VLPIVYVKNDPKAWIGRDLVPVTLAQQTIAIRRKVLPAPCHLPIVFRQIGIWMGEHVHREGVVRVGDQSFYQHGAAELSFYILSNFRDRLWHVDDFVSARLQFYHCIQECLKVSGVLTRRVDAEDLNAWKGHRLSLRALNRHAVGAR
jgi:hypothetical protein